jgi:hypothetical protein
VKSDCIAAQATPDSFSYGFLPCSDSLAAVKTLTPANQLNFHAHSCGSGFR